MTLQDIYQQAKKILTQAGCDSPAFDAFCLFSHHFGMDRSRYLLEKASEADPALLGRFREDIHRRAGGMPLQYLLSEWEFMGHPFFVGEGVLIPRADTETLVETALVQIRGASCPVVVDLCAGSGCVGISIALACPQARVYLVELSPEALFYIEKNKTRYNLQNVTVLSADILQGEGLDKLPEIDMLLSNPPYIPTCDLPDLQREVQREPVMALDGGEDGLRFYRAIAQHYFPALRDGALVAVECGIGQAVEVRRIFAQAGIQNLCTHKDKAGIPRVVAGTGTGSSEIACAMEKN